LLRERWPYVPVVEDLGEAVAWILENGKWRKENGT